MRKLRERENNQTRHWNKVPRQQEEETVAINHHPCNRQPQEHPEVGIAMMTMRTKGGEKVDGTRDPQGRIKHGRTMSMGKRRPLGTRYGSSGH